MLNLLIPDITRKGVLPTSVTQRAPSWLDYERTPAQHSHNLWGSKHDSGACGQLRGDAVLVGEPAEDLLPADPALGEVDLFWRAGVG
jgi:hypothetical protein